MKSDLFHDVARAYYGMSPELYSVCNAGDVDQYAAEMPHPPESLEGPSSTDAPQPIKQPRSSKGQKGLFHDIDPETISAPEKVYTGETPYPGMTGILQPGDIQESLGEIAPQHMNHDQAWLSLDRDRPDKKKDPKAFLEWWNRNKRLNRYRRMMAHTEHPDSNPLESLGLDSVPGSGIQYALGDAQVTGTGEPAPYAIPNAKAKAKRWKRPRGKKGKLPEKNCATACK